MNAIEAKRYEMLVRVSQFGKDHGDLFPGTSQARQHFADVAAAVKELSGSAVEKMRAEDDAKTRKTTGRRALCGRLRAMSRTARLIEGDNPGMQDKFVFPDPQTDQALVTAGRMFAQDAEAFTKPFVAQGMPKTFIADLKALVDRFEQALNDRSASDAAHATARKAIAAALAAGTTAARKLDAMMANQQIADPAIVELWSRDRRVGHPPRRKAADTTPAVGETPAAENATDAPATASAIPDPKKTSEQKVA